MSRCKKCLLPDAVPGSDIDSNLVCSFCRAATTAQRAENECQREAFEEDLEQALRDCRGKGPYDCLVTFSGGKDSIYLLYKLVVEYRLKVLAFTCDLDIPKIGWENIRRTVEALDFSHVIYRPSMNFYKKIFRQMLKNQDDRGAVKSVCYITAPLTEGYALRMAAEQGIPLVLTGYSPGQPDPDWMLYEMPRVRVENSWVPPILTQTGLFDDSELNYFWDPARLAAGTKIPRVLAPFHAWKYHQSELMEKVIEKGLVKGRRRANPLFTNSPFQWLLMYSDLKLLGYNPYAPEFCGLIRNGSASRELWKLMFPALNFMLRNRVLLGRYVTQTCRWLDFDLKDLAITRRYEPLQFGKGTKREGAKEVVALGEHANVSQIKTLSTTMERNWV